MPWPTPPSHHPSAHLFTPPTHTQQIRGVKTNLPFLENVMAHPVILEGAPTTAFIELYANDLFKWVEIRLSLTYFVCGCG